MTARSVAVLLRVTTIQDEMMAAHTRANQANACWEYTFRNESIRSTKGRTACACASLRRMATGFALRTVVLRRKTRLIFAERAKKTGRCNRNAHRPAAFPFRPLAIRHSKNGNLASLTVERDRGSKRVLHGRAPDRPLHARRPHRWRTEARRFRVLPPERGSCTASLQNRRRHAPE